MVCYCAGDMRCRVCAGKQQDDAGERHAGGDTWIFEATWRYRRTTWHPLSISFANWMTRGCVHVCTVQVYSWYEHDSDVCQVVGGVRKCEVTWKYRMMPVVFLFAHYSFVEYREILVGWYTLSIALGLSDKFDAFLSAHCGSAVYFSELIGWYILSIALS